MIQKTIRLERRELFPVFCVAAGYSLIVYVLGWVVLRQFPNSADEFAFLYQAYTFASGSTANTAHFMQEALVPFFIQTYEDQVFSIFPPGWAVVLGLGVMLSMPWVVNPLIAGMTVVVLYLLSRQFLSRRYSWVVIVLWMSSPMVLFNGASLFSHSFCSLLIVTAALFLVRCSHQVTVMNGILAGLFAASAFCTRELTTVALLLLPLLFSLYQTKQKVKLILYCLIGALPIAVLYGWYCAQITGYWFYPPRYLLPDEYLGFGWREINVFDYVEQQYHGVYEALTIMFQNVGLLLLWTTAAFPLFALCFFWLSRHNHWIMVFAGSTLLLLLSYMLYPSGGGNQYGARFYYESLPFLAITAVYSFPIPNGWKLQQKHYLKLGGYLFLFVGWSLSTGYIHLQQVNKTIYARQDVYRQIEHKELENAIVFIASPSGDMTQGDLIRNLPGFESAPVMYAWDLGPQRNRELLQHFPERQSYRYHQSSAGNFNVISVYNP